MISKGIIVLVTIAAFSHALFEVPEVQIQAIDPVGIRVAIEAVDGIRLFIFNAKINDGIIPNKTWDVTGEAKEAVDGKFIIADNETKLIVGNILNYEVFVRYGNLGYWKDGEPHTIKELVTQNTSFATLIKVEPSIIKESTNCNLGDTTVNGLRKCKDEIIFEENFKGNSIDNDKWQIETKLTNNEQENAFNSYQPSSVKIETENLIITPYLQSEIEGYEGNNTQLSDTTLDLTKTCTDPTKKLCKEICENRFLLPSVVSGRVTTRNKFRFKYGKIEIRAKLPQGDWIYPELLLEPADSKYGTVGYQSGIIRIAFARGNHILKEDEKEIGNNVLYGGLLLGQNVQCRKFTTVNNSDISKPWGKMFHTYGMTWTEDSITFEVDNIKYGTITPPPNGFKSLRSENSCQTIAKVFKEWENGRNIAPFDQEFYITLGVAVGGVSDFSDTLEKPWKNSNRKARSKFWNNKSTWYPTWDDNKYLVIDSVKVRAL